MEQLEDRCTPANFVVTTANDNLIANDGFITLREAVRDANGAGPGQHHIDFDSSLAGATITLGAAGTLGLSKSIYINGAIGLGAGNITIQRDTTKGNFRLFDVSTGSISTIFGLTLKNGNGGAGGGGAIYSNGNLTVSNCTITQNSTSWRGGGIYAAGGTLDVNDSQVNGNNAESGGGIALSAGVPLNITNSTVGLNYASNQGGGIYAGGGINRTVSVSGCTITGNITANGGGGIWFSSGTLQLSNNTQIGDNQVTGANKWGGGVMLFSGTINLFGVTIGDNSAAIGDGIWRAVGTTENIGPFGVTWNNDGEVVG